MTRDDWRALIEAFLADESDAATFKEEFMEAWEEVAEGKTRVPPAVEELQSTVEAYDETVEDEDAETELRDEARKALELLKA
jgi:hypothetical protein